MVKPIERIIRRGACAALPAAAISGLPSTLHALLTRRDPLEASLAAGSIILPRETGRVRLLIAAGIIHLSLSFIWATVLAVALPRKKPVVEGAVAGMLIAGLDLGLMGRRFPRVRALDTPPQVADHLAFGIAVALALARQDRLARCGIKRSRSACFVCWDLRL